MRKFFLTITGNLFFRDWSFSLNHLGQVGIEKPSWNQLPDDLLSEWLFFEELLLECNEH
jgi:hypothetical protein